MKVPPEPNATWTRTLFNTAYLALQICAPEDAGITVGGRYGGSGVQSAEGIQKGYNLLM
jgi:hypothetical protein